jgi:hypothetical protein
MGASGVGMERNEHLPEVFPARSTRTCLLLNQTLFEGGGSYPG